MFLTDKDIYLWKTFKENDSTVEYLLKLVIP